jgi:hypothetical protein
MSRPCAITLAASLVLVAGVDAAQRKVLDTQRFPLPSSARVAVDVASTTVHVRSSDVLEVEVTNDLRISGVGEDKAAAWIDRHTPTIVAGEDGLDIRVEPGRDGFLGLGLLTARARMYVVTPATAVPDVTTGDGDIRVHGDFPEAAPLRLRTATGGMELEGATRELEIRSASGDARIQVIRPIDRIFARTSSGDIDLEGGARQVEIDTASGDVRLRNLSGSATVATSTGKIVLHFDRVDPDSTIDVRTASGRVHIVLPEGARPRGTLSTTTGTIRCDLEARASEVGNTLELTGDGVELVVDTASGEIVVEVADVSIPWSGGN